MIWDIFISTIIDRILFIRNHQIIIIDLILIIGSRINDLIFIEQQVGRYDLYDIIIINNNLILIKKCKQIMLIHGKCINFIHSKTNITFRL